MPKSSKLSLSLLLATNRHCHSGGGFQLKSSFSVCFTQIHSPSIVGQWVTAMGIWVVVLWWVTIVDRCLVFVLWWVTMVNGYGFCSLMGHECEGEDGFAGILFGLVWWLALMGASIDLFGSMNFIWWVGGFEWFLGLMVCVVFDLWLFNFPGFDYFWSWSLWFWFFGFEFAGFVHGVHGVLSDFSFTGLELEFHVVFFFHVRPILVGPRAF